LKAQEKGGDTVVGSGTEELNAQKTGASSTFVEAEKDLAKAEDDLNNLQKAGIVSGKKYEQSQLDVSQARASTVVIIKKDLEKAEDDLQKLEDAGKTSGEEHDRALNIVSNLKQKVEKMNAQERGASKFEGSRDGGGVNRAKANGGGVNGFKDFELLKARAGLTALLTGAKAFGYGIPTPGPDKPPTPSSDTKIYTNKPYGLIANVPSKWKINENDSDPNDGLVEVAHIYPSASTDEKVEIGIDDKPTDLTLEAYLKSTSDIHKGNFGGINVLELNTNSKVAGKPAYRIVFTLKDKTTEIMETGFIVGDKVYHITYTAKPESYLSNLPAVQNIANSLKISK